MNSKKFRMLPVLVLTILLMGVPASCGSKTEGKKVAGLDDIKGSRIGVQLGTVSDIYVSDYEGDKEGTKITRYSHNNDAVEALKQGKLDCFVLDEQPAKAFAEKNDSLKILDESFADDEYAIVIAKGNDSLREKINAALKEAQAEGILDKLKDTYLYNKGDFHYQQKVTEGPELVMGTNATFPPYEYYDGDQPVGFDVEMAKCIADKLGMKLKIQDMDFDGIIDAVNAGKVDVGISGFTVTEERKQSIDFSDPYTNCKQVIMVKAEGAGHGASIGEQLSRNFVKEARWAYIAKGLGVTLIVTLFAGLIGICLGFLLALVRVSHDLNGSLKLLNIFARAYLGVIRGTPVMVQLLIIYYVIFASVDINRILVAIVAFGLNSAAYVAEIMRSGIMAVDPGQLEAGKSLGLPFGSIMIQIILPQAFKNVLPALANEFIALLKETSISGYIGLADLTRGGMIIRSITYDSFPPLLAVAAVYLAIVLGMTHLVGRLERRLKVNER